MAQDFFDALQARIAPYDLLQHPFYQAWSAGELTREDLRAYAQQYYRHVEAFPGYLERFAAQLPQGQLRNAVVANMDDELGNSQHGSGRSHAELWLDFAEGMGAKREAADEKLAEMEQLITFFSDVAAQGSPHEALAAFYAYESQVPRIAGTKEKGLREFYQADDNTCAYFTVHAVADVHHSAVWRAQLEKLVANDTEAAEAALAAAEATGQKLWHALDGINRQRLVGAPVCR